MTCREFADFLDDYLAANLSVAALDCFDEHLGECPDCVAYLQTYRDSVRVTKAAHRDDDGTPDDVPEDLLRAILAAKASGRDHA